MKPYNFEQLQKEALKYKNKTDFRKGNLRAYTEALKNDKYIEIVAHMPKYDGCGEKHHKFKWTLEKLKKEADKYETRAEFQKMDPAGYLAATRSVYYDKISSHMPQKADMGGNNNPNFRWPLERIQKEANRYMSRIEFMDGSPKAYGVAIARPDYEQIVAHMFPSETKAHTLEEIVKEASKYRSRSTDLEVNSQLEVLVNIRQHEKEVF